MLRPILKIVVLVLLVSAETGAADAAKEKRVALVIGNAAYAHITQLNKPNRDAEKVAEVLKGLEYEVILGVNATKAELESLAERFKTALAGADVGLFFYSGHGFQTNRAEQQHPVNHIVPVDFDIDGSDPAQSTLALDIVVTALKNEARVGLIFMDACRSDPVLAAAAERLARDSKAVTIARGFSPVNVSAGGPPSGGPVMRGKGPAGLLIAYATDPGNVALEGDTGPYSPFTGALVKHMGTPGLSVAEVMGRVSADVAMETQGQQTPWNVSSLTAGTYKIVATATQVTPNQVSREPSREPATAKKTSEGSSGSTTAKRSGGRSTNNNLPPNLGVGVGGGL